MAPPDHTAAYAALTEQLMASLTNVHSRDSARRFARDGAKLVRRSERQVSEFYVGEFLDLFKDEVVRRLSTTTGAVQHDIDSAELDAQVGTVELRATMEAASAADDQEAKHNVWKERNKRQRAVQGRLDASSELTKLVEIRLDAFHRLADALDMKFS